MKQHGDDLRLKPDDWQLKLCKNCEHLMRDEDYYCENDGDDIEVPELMSCTSFKNQYR